MLILLDLDGTLIHDRGYRVAIDATVTHYAGRHGLPVYTPSDDDVHVLHAHGFSNEWDTVAFLAGILHHAQATHTPGRPDYQAWTRKTANVRGLPNERAREVLLQASPPELYATVHTLLDRVTDLNHAPTTRLFAEMILGSELFARHYGLAPELHTLSLLETLDESLITDRSRAVIRSHRVCIFTARPSLPPRRRAPDAASDGVVPVHPPEAEIGLKLLQLEHLPMIALGHVQWLADQHGERVYDLTKPSPVQALAAMLAARDVDEHAALVAAYDLWKQDRLGPEFALLRGEEVYVLEDNAGGVRACHEAAALLARQGVAVTIHGLGISAAEAKRLALLPVCEKLYKDVNDAFADLDRR